MPTYGKVHTDALINNLMTARMLKPEDAIANEVFPMVTVNRPSDKFPILNNGFLRKDDDSLGYKGVANTITWDFDTAGSFISTIMDTIPKSKADCSEKQTSRLRENIECLPVVL